MDELDIDSFNKDIWGSDSNKLIGREIERTDNLKNHETDEQMVGGRSRSTATCDIQTNKYYKETPS